MNESETNNQETNKPQPNAGGGLPGMNPAGASGPATGVPKAPGGFDFKNDPAFGARVFDGFHKITKETVHWLNGDADTHNALLKMTTTAHTRQQGFERAVWELAANPDGSHRYKGKVLLHEFYELGNKVWLRTYGMLILGYDDGEEDEESKGKSLFDKETDALLGKSEPEN